MSYSNVTYKLLLCSILYYIWAFMTHLIIKPDVELNLSVFSFRLLTSGKLGLSFHNFHTCADKKIPISIIKFVLPWHIFKKIPISIKFVLPWHIFLWWIPLNLLEYRHQQVLWRSHTTGRYRYNLLSYSFSLDKYRITIICG